MKIIKLQSSQQGFTILELMIATTILSVLLVMVSVVMIGIGSLYQKGINQARVQSAARTITDDLSQHLQLRSGSSASPLKSTQNRAVSISGTNFTIEAYCTTDTRYSYIVGVQRGTNSTSDNPQIPHVLWRDNVPSGGCSNQVPADLTDVNLAGGTEMIPPNSRLTVFNISTVSPHTISIGIAYGDLDLLDPAVGINARCKGSAGRQFCATVRLQTTAGQRL